jgi:two-component system OmpR family response regulator
VPSTSSISRRLPAIKKPDRARSDLIVVVADDDPGIRSIVAQLLQLNGFFPLTCPDGKSALELVAKAQPALVLLDVRMPALDGLAACRAIRQTSQTPVIILTVMDDESEAAKALDAGADDYIRKPFGAHELISRVKAVLRRAGDRTMGDTLAVGSLRLDETQRIAQVEGSEVHLSTTEFDLLAYLMRNAERVVTHIQLLDHIWGYDYGESRQAIRLVVHRLRRKLTAAKDVELETMAGVGYRIKARPYRVDPDDAGAKPPGRP